jgi:hypothetical protein
VWLTLIGVACVITILLVVVLVTPVEVELSAVKAAGDPAVRVKANARWLGLRLPGPPASRRSAKTRPNSGGRRTSIEWSSLRAVLTTPGFMRRFVRLVSEEVRLTRPRRVSLRARVGLDDPSETAMLLAWAYSLRGASIRIEPDFTDEVAEGELKILWSRSPGALLWPVVKFAASPVVWRAFWHARRSHA